MYYIAAYLLDVLLLFLLQGQFYEDLLELLVAVVDDELFKAILLQTKGTLCENLLIFSALVVLKTRGWGWEGLGLGGGTYLKHFKSIDVKDTHDLCP